VQTVEEADASVREADEADLAGSESIFFDEIPRGRGRPKKQTKEPAIPSESDPAGALKKRGRPRKLIDNEVFEFFWHCNSNC